MTNLSPTQIALLDAVEAAKLKADAELERLRLRHKQEEWDAQVHLRLAVGNARDAGVPWRRLQDPLETSDHKTVKSFYPSNEDRIKEREAENDSTD